MTFLLLTNALKILVVLYSNKSSVRVWLCFPIRAQKIRKKSHIKHLNFSKNMIVMQETVSAVLVRLKNKFTRSAAFPFTFEGHYP